MKLFNLIVSEDELHPNFRNIYRTENVFEMDVLLDWARGFLDRDGKFVKEFQTTFNSSFWELYVFAVLKKFDIAVDFSLSSPDFISSDFCLEAVIATNSQGGEPEHERLKNMDNAQCLNEFNRESIIRSSNAISEKLRKYRSQYCKFDQVQNKPFIIAFADFSQPHSFLACQRPLEALLFEYYVDEEDFLKRESPRRLERFNLKNVTKHNGANIELGLFNNDSCKEISALFYNHCATWGKARALSNSANANCYFDVIRYNPNSYQPYV